MVGGYGAGAPDGEGGAGGTEGDILVPLPLPADKRTELFLGNGQGGDQRSALDPNAFLGLTSSARQGLKTLMLQMGKLTPCGGNDTAKVTRRWDLNLNSGLLPAPGLMAASLLASVYPCSAQWAYERLGRL